FLDGSVRYVPNPCLYSTLLQSPQPRAYVILSHRSTVGSLGRTGRRPAATAGQATRSYSPVRNVHHCRRDRALRSAVSKRRLYTAWTALSHGRLAAFAWLRRYIPGAVLGPAHHRWLLSRPARLRSADPRS